MWPSPRPVLQPQRWGSLCLCLCFSASLSHIHKHIHTHYFKGKKLLWMKKPHSKGWVCCASFLTLSLYSEGWAQEVPRNLPKHSQSFLPTDSMTRSPHWSFAFISSVQFICSVVSDSLQPHEPQHARPPCPSPTPGVHPNPCPLIESVMSSNHLILCRPHLLLPSILPSIRVFRPSIFRGQTARTGSQGLV